MENMRPLIIVVAVGAVLVVVAALFFSRDDAAVEPPSPHGATSTASPGDGNSAKPIASAIARDGASATATGGGVATSTGGSHDEDEPGAGPTERDGSPSTNSGGSWPMEAAGAARGIDTTMDADWSPQSEAQGWFSALDDAFVAARPLSPQSYREIMHEHQGTVTDVLKRAAEIADEKGQEEGMAFLEEWNAQVEQYKQEATGSI